MRARVAMSLKMTGCPDALSSAQAASTRVSLSRSAGIGLVDEQVEPLDEAAVAAGLAAPAAGGSDGGERFGVGVLQLQHGEEASLGAEVRAMFADVGIGARSLGGGAQAVPAGEPSLDQRRVPPVPAGDRRDRQLGPLPGQHRAELGLGLSEDPLVLVADGGLEQPAVSQAHLRGDMANHGYQRLQRAVRVVAAGMLASAATWCSS